MNYQANQYKDLIRDAFALSLQLKTKAGFEEVVTGTGGTITCDDLRGLVYVDYPDGSGLTLYVETHCVALAHAPLDKSPDPA